MSKLQHAILIAQAAHYGQTDKGGRPTFDHCAHVSSQFDNETYQIVGVLHDTMEDSPLMGYEACVSLFGDEVAQAVDAISRRPNEKYFDYINRCNLNPIARAVKIADIHHNSDRSRWPDMPDSYLEREKKALAILTNPPIEGKE